MVKQEKPPVPIWEKKNPNSIHKSLTKNQQRAANAFGKKHGGKNSFVANLAGLRAKK